MTIDQSVNLDWRQHAGPTGPEISRRVVDVDARRVSYLVAGESSAAPAVLLIHGSGMSANCWVHQLRGLHDAFRVLAIDLPGHGRSDPMPRAGVDGHAETVTRFLDALGAGPALVVGHSLGGAVAIALAARRPDLVRGLVLLASCVKLPRLDGSRGHWLAYLPWPLRRIVFFSVAQEVLFAPGVPGHVVSFGMQELRSCRAETIMDDLDAARAMDLTHQATALAVPTLVVCGSRDRLTPPPLSEHLSALIPRSRLRIIEGAGHMLLLEVPDRVNQEVLTFAESLTVGACSATRARGRRGRPLVRRLLDWGRAVMGTRARRVSGSQP